MSFFTFSCDNSDATPAKAETPAQTTPAKPTTPAKKAAAVESTGDAKFEFVEKVYDFGTINSGEKAEKVYTFKNVGTEPLIISNVKGTCGCTAPSWTKEPVAVGETGEIKVVFNSRGKSGKINKAVNITANTSPNRTTLRISGNVVKTAPAKK
ncbi:MAG: DUF1573 domain-containing protein [Flavobacteriales bacterium]